MNSAYAIVAIATIVNRTADVRPTLSPKLSNPTARPPSSTVKLSHDRKVRSFAKKTLGSTRVGRAMRFPEDGISKILTGEREVNEGTWAYLELSGEEVGWTLLERRRGDDGGNS